MGAVPLIGMAPRGRAYGEGMRGPSALALALAAAACTRASAPAPPREARSGGAADASALTAVAADAAARARACRVSTPPSTLDDGDGLPDPEGTTRLENLRLLAAGGTVVATWERQSDYRVGDSSRAPVVAMPAGAAKPVLLPVAAYACATYGHVGPASLDAPIVAWGVENARALQVWKAPPAFKPGPGAPALATRPAMERATPRQELDELVVSGRVALATTFELSCDVGCNCPNPTARGLWTYSLAPGAPAPAKLASGAPAGKTPDAPALAMGDAGGVAAYRKDGALHAAWLDADGRPAGAQLRLDAGDVGAPAVAVAGKRAVLAWARRDAKSEPYRVRWVALELGAAAAPAPAVLPAAGSAFAPGVLTDGADAVFVWTEGDDGSRGAVFASRVPLADASRASPALAVSGPDEPNARDPEVSGTVSAPVLVYGAFSKARPGGVARLATLACE